MAVGLAACGGGLLQNSDTADASLAQKAKPAVALAPAQGVPQKYAAKVNEQLAASIKAKGVQIVEAKDAQYIIKPSFLALPEPKQGTKVTYSIDVTDKAGNKVRHIAGEELVSTKRGGDSWGHVTEEAVQKVAVKSGADINAWIENPNAQPTAPAPAVATAKPAAPPAKAVAQNNPKPAAAQPASATEGPTIALAADPQATAKPAQTGARGEIVAVVAPVTGAPGDGKTSLSEAMKRALGRQGVKLASTSAPGMYKVQGQVELGATTNGEQPIKITWIVTDPNGKQIDKSVVQSNRIAAGSLDKNWGEVADLVAAPAAAEVMKLLSKQTPQAQQATPRTAG